MMTFEIQSIEIASEYERAFDYISAAKHLPEWTNAFASASDHNAVLRTPTGSVEVELMVKSSRPHGTIDWVMKFPDGSHATAYSRLFKVGNGASIYSFVLLTPPAPLVELEGTLNQQSEILKEELTRLRTILERKK